MCEWECVVKGPVNVRPSGASVWDRKAVLYLTLCELLCSVSLIGENVTAVWRANYIVIFNTSVDKGHAEGCLVSESENVSAFTECVCLVDCQICFWVSMPGVQTVSDWHARDCLSVCFKAKCLTLNQILQTNKAQYNEFICSQVVKSILK